VTDQQRYSQHRPINPRVTRSSPLWHTYVGITGLLLVIVVALVGGIIWYNSTKSNQLAIAAAERLMQEAGEDISDRIKLLYDPMYAIVGIASQVPELTSPTIKDDPHAMSLTLRVLRIYPQILSLYVGFNDGDFFMVTHIAGENSTELRAALHAPETAAFANEIVSQVRMANAVPSGSSLTKMAGLSVAAIRLPPISIPVSALGTISQSAVRPSNRVIFTYSPPAVNRALPSAAALRARTRG
jgi:hypothetical protein